MKSTGIVRKVDELGRIVIPIELRRALGVDVKDPIEIFVEDDRIILQKYTPNAEKEDVIKNLKTMADNASVFGVETINRAIKLIK